MHQLVAGGKSPDGDRLVTLVLDVGLMYDLRFRDSNGQVGPSTRVSAHSDREFCEWWVSAVPRSVGHAAAQAAVSLVRAIDAGEGMLRCDVLLPGLNQRVEAACGIDDRLLQLLAFELARALTLAGRQTMLLYDSAGTSASGEASWRQLYGTPPPDSLKFRALTNKPVTRDEARGIGSKPPWDFSPSVSPEAQTDAYLVVRPRNSRGDAVVLALMQAVEKVPGATWVLINPELEDTALRSTFSIRETDRYMAFLKQFAQFYLARGMYLVRRPSMSVQERGHLGMRYGDSWDALKRTVSGGFMPLARFPVAPTSSEIDLLPW